jgi:hypothetical protein
VKGFEALAGVADGDDLGVCGGVVFGGDPVAAAADDFIALHDHSAKRAAFAATHHLHREADGFAHKFFVYGGGVNISEPNEAKGKKEKLLTGRV